MHLKNHKTRAKANNLKNVASANKSIYKQKIVLIAPSLTGRESNLVTIPHPQYNYQRQGNTIELKKGY